jgi:hypothetical protein
MFFVAPPPLAFLLDWWEARLPLLAFEQERIVVVSKKAPAETPAAHLSIFSIFVAVVNLELMRKAFIEHLICRLRQQVDVQERKRLAYAV